MKKGIHSILALIIGPFLHYSPAALDNVLHYHNCTFPGFGCWSGPRDTYIFQELSAEYGFKLKQSADTNELMNVGKYDLVVFDNAGDAGGVLRSTSPLRQAFREYMESGGKFLGFNGTADHRGVWPWFDTVIFSGTRFHGFDPNLTAKRVFLYPGRTASQSDPALARMWGYARDSLKISPDMVPIKTAVLTFTSAVDTLPEVKVIQELREGVFPKAYTWAKDLPNGGRVLYTGLGRPEDWEYNDAWLKKAAYAYMRYLVGDFDTAPVVLAPEIRTRGSRLENRAAEGQNARITDIRGKTVFSGPGKALAALVLEPGVYFVSVGKTGALVSKTIVLSEKGSLGTGR
jgi:hypothetical protein